MSYFTSYENSLKFLNRSNSESLFSTQPSLQAGFAEENLLAADNNTKKNRWVLSECEVPVVAPSSRNWTWLVWCSGSIGDCGNLLEKGLRKNARNLLENPSRIKDSAGFAKPMVLQKGLRKNAWLQSSPGPGSIPGTGPSRFRVAVPKLRRIAVATRRVSDCAGRGFAC